MVMGPSSSSSSSSSTSLSSSSSDSRPSLMSYNHDHENEEENDDDVFWFDTDFNPIIPSKWNVFSQTTTSTTNTQKRQPRRHRSPWSTWNNGLSESIEMNFEQPSLKDILFDLIFRIVVIGDRKIGKTTLCQNFVQNCLFEPSRPSSSAESTLLLNNQTRRVPIDESHTILNLQVLDMKNRKFLRKLRDFFWSTTVGVMLAFDVTKRSTFESIEKWLNRIQRMTGGVDRCVIQLVALKANISIGEQCSNIAVDSQNFSPQVSNEEAQALAIKHNLDYVETSKCSTNINNQLLFRLMAKRLYQKFLSGQILYQPRFLGCCQVTKYFDPSLSTTDYNNQNSFKKINSIRRRHAAGYDDDILVKNVVQYFQNHHS